jgi:hypothetical protein
MLVRPEPNLIKGGEYDEKIVWIYGFDGGIVFDGPGVANFADGG